MDEVVIRLSPVEFYIYLSLLILIIIVATPTNLLLSVAICRYRELWNPHNILLLNLCISNLMSSLGVASLSISLLVMGQYGCQTNRVVCYLRHIVLFASVIANLWIFTTLSYVKYESVARPFKKRLNNKKLRKILMFLWSVVLLLTAAATVEHFMTKERQCMMVSTVLRGQYFYYSVTILSGMIMVPLTSFLFMKIIYILKGHRKNFMARDRRSMDSTFNERRLETKPVIMVAVVFTTYLLLWTPCGIVRILTNFGGMRGNRNLDRMSVFTGILVLFFGVVQPITVLAMTPILRKAVKNVLLCRRRRGSLGTRNEFARTVRGESVVTLFVSTLTRQARSV